MFRVRCFIPPPSALSQRSRVDSFWDETSPGAGQTKASTVLIGDEFGQLKMFNYIAVQVCTSCISNYMWI